MFAASASACDSTGALSFIAAPDFEKPADADKNNHYLVQVGATDGALIDVQTLTVRVTDVAPLIIRSGIVNGTAENDTMRGGNGKDTLRGLGEKDRIDGRGGIDRLDGGVNDDRLFGGAGNDKVNGEMGADSVDCGDGNDTVIGGAHDDALTGGAGVDSLDGDNPNPYGPAGTADNCDGGAETDTATRCEVISNVP